MTLLASLTQTLDNALSQTPEQRFETSAWLALAHQHGEAIFARATPSHITGSIMILNPEGTHTCLVLHGRIKVWVQPGGHVEPDDETMADAARREALEETGLEVATLLPAALLDRHRAPCGADWHLDVRFTGVCEQTPPVISSESDDVRWWAIDDLPGLHTRGLLAPGVLESAQAARLSLLAAG